MKPSHSPRGGRLMTGVLACLFSITSAVSATDIPKGTLTVDRSLLRVGSRPDLAWQITYPTDAASVVETKTADFTADLPVEVMWSRKSSSWAAISYGTQPAVHPSTIVMETTVKKNDTVNFGSRCHRSNLPHYNTAVATPNLVMPVTFE